MTMPNPPRPRSGIAVALSIALLAALNLYVFRDHWRGVTSFTFDFPATYYAATSYWIASLQTGEWPHWIPYQSLGYPAALNLQLGLFYPPFWVFVLLRLPYTLHAANIVQALHVLFGSIGFFCFARRSFRLSVALAGAVCFALFGGFYSNAEHADIVRGFSWVPWLFWALLLDDTPAERSIGGWRVLTRLRAPNLFLPLIAGCFITGSYPGLIISGLSITGVFLAAQTGALLFIHRGRPDAGSPIRDGIVQCAQVAMGIGMAAVYLWPAVRLTGDMTRTYNAAVFTPWYLHPADFYQLFLPSNLVTNGDYSMYGMQLPMVMLLFLPLARVRAGLLAPIAGAAAVSAVMSFSGLSAVSGWISRVAPVFRLSRFPAGDYRIFLYLAVLTCALAGLDRAAAKRPAARRNTVYMFDALGALLLLCALLFRTRLPAGAEHTLLWFVALEGLGCALAAGAYLLFAAKEWPGRLWVHLITAGCILMMVPTLTQMKPFWSDPQIEPYLYSPASLPLEGPDHRLSVYGIFSRHEARRPARIPQPTPLPGVPALLFRGYVDGSYMTWDQGGGGKSVGLVTVVRNPSLMAVMLQPGELLEVDCAPQLCAGAAVDGVDLAGRPVVGRPLQYSRNYAVYDVDLAARSLIVENEMDAPGWSGYCETHGERLLPERVDRSLRGWVLGPGHHRLRVSYRTPLLAPGAMVSAFFLACWLASVVLWRATCQAGAQLRAKYPQPVQ